MANQLKSDFRIWIVEDEPGVQFVYKDILCLRYHIEFFSTLSDFKKKAAEGTQNPDLIIADLSLPDGNFFEVLSEKKSAFLIASPLIIVSSIDDLDILRACFDEGALDYLIKPFIKNELIVKIERILAHRGRIPENLSLGKGELILELEALRLRRGKDLDVQLTAKEFHIFSLLYQSVTKAVSKTKLQSTVWGDTAVCEKALDVHLFNLRKKIAKLNLEIRYVPSEGYQLYED